MNTSEANAIIDTLAEYPRCFIQEELFSFIWDDEDQPILLQSIKRDSRFLQTQNGTTKEKIFIAKKALYHWYVGLNIRLARAQKTRLSGRKLALLMSSLRLDDQWNVPPSQYVEFGELFSFVKPGWSPYDYVFPLAHVISFMTSSKMKIAAEILNNFNNTPWLELPSEKMVLRLIEDSLAKLTPRERYVIARREGILGNTKMTLDQIGEELNLTRERVRQIEVKSWKKLRHPTYSHRFIASLLFDIMCHEGSLLIESEPMRYITMFVAKCNNIPISTFLHSDIVILGAAKEDITRPKNLWQYALDVNEIATILETSNKLSVRAKDIKTLAERLTQFVNKNLTKEQRVYLALKHINRPAHSTEINEVYNSLFPDHPSSEHNTHAVLSREKHGVVWIGIRSTFALSEWGYEHPSETLFKTVSEIVQRRFSKTGRPVPFIVISAEIGKYRRVVRLASLTIATYCNPNLENIYKDYFIPKAGDQEEKEISAKELDRILQQFERQVRGQENGKRYR